MKKIVLDVKVSPELRKIIEEYTQYDPQKEWDTIDTDPDAHKRYFDDYERGRHFIELLGKVMVDKLVRQLPVGDKELTITLTAEE